MKHRIAMALAFASAGLLTPAAEAIPVYVKVAPPTPVVEVRVAAPGPNYIWVGGFHKWNGTAYVWVPGRWALPPHGRTVWVVGHWKHSHHGYYWVDGHWR